MQSNKFLSRRRLMIGGAIAGFTGSLGLAALTPRFARAGDRMSGNMDMDMDMAIANDIEILNGALYYENQAIWAYQTAAGALSKTDVGQAVMQIAVANLEDHQVHRDTLAQVVEDLGGMPTMAQSEYDLSSYLEKGEGGLDSDVNIAKLALALETDAAIGYGMEIAKLKTPELITAGAAIAATEASHATTIRAAFVSLGMDIPYVPAPFVSADTREAWVLQV
ncbi:MAG: DUF4439 domain-containing protein [Jaaginema sp. PMC 1079.18]|nr:DUF4439 domain-containing protein [Jaaginema sp. PMC 1080.18]MEC4853930.1 DUF4439 domain-containing protein [Jaaginema sp. PMC 1079.18]MEC4864912.1 DUF4439 domain-containing protein [Jaaginema sp. PMC 1078.18]